MKKILKVILWLIIGLIIALILLPIIYKDQVYQSIKDQINEQVNATVDFDDVGLSIFKNFPALSIDLQDVKIEGVDQFVDVTLLRAKNIYIGTDLKSMIKPQEGITIRSIKLTEPTINVLVDKNGKANYDITKESKSSSESNYMGEIESYEIKDGVINYTDNQAKLKFNLKDIDHSGKGSFKNVVFDLTTKTEIEEINLSSSGISYLNAGHLIADVDLGVDLDKQKYTLKNNLIRYNDLDVSFVGDILMKAAGIDINIDFEAPNNKVSSLLSLIPSNVSKEFSDVKSEGTSYFKGKINGLYNGDTNKFPNIDITAKIDNGVVQYPGLKLPISDISLDTRVLSQSSSMNDLSIDVKKFGFKINEDRIVGQVKIDNALDKPTIDGMMNGTVDLVALSNAYPLDNIDIRDGKLKTDFTIKATAEDIENQNYSKVNFKGDITSNDVDLNYEQWPIKLKSSKSEMTPGAITTTFAAAKIGESDFNGDVKINNPLAFLSDVKEASTVTNIQSQHLNLDELQKLSEASPQTSDTLTTSLSLYEDFNVVGTYDAKDVTYQNYEIDDLSFSGKFNEDNLDINKVSLKLDNSPIKIRGNAKNITAYVFNNEKLNGKIFLDADKINANKYLNESGETTELTEAFIIPKNVDLEIYPEIKKLIYDNYDLSNVEGKIAIKEGKAMLSDGVAEAMGGRINLDGLYNTFDPANPAFDLRYNMEGIDFAKIFEYSESFSKLAPIAKFIEGLFNSTLVISGPIKDDMMPDLSNITASGFLETLKGQVIGFGPLEQLGEAIGIDKLKNLNIKGTKNWFDVKDGRVVLKPNDHQIDDMKFTIGGNHGIDQTLDYTIKALIPRDKLRNDKLGKNLEFGMDFIEKEASSRGVNIDLGEMIYLDIYMTGTLLKPKFKVIPVGSGGKTLTDVAKDEVTKQVQVLKDTITQEIEKRTEIIKDTVSKVLSAKTDTLKSQAKEKIDEQIEKKKTEMKDILKGKIDTAVTERVSDTLRNALEDKAKKVLGEKSQDEIDNIKDKLKDWSPFKKKGG